MTKMATSEKDIFLDTNTFRWRFKKEIICDREERAENFRVENIVKQYEDIIEAVCAESAGK
jgi:hypothetical protein